MLKSNLFKLIGFKKNFVKQTLFLAALLVFGIDLCGAREYSGLPLVNVETENFDGSGNCAICHHLLVDPQGKSISIHDYWRSTMMANAAKDPLWQAKVFAEVNSNPALKNIIEEKCVTCHMPMAWTESESKKQESGFQPGFLDKDNPLNGVAMDGVSCSLCHQMTDYKFGEKESFSGKYKVDTDTVEPERKLYGPFKDVEQVTMRTSVGYEPVHGEHMLTSEFCATCHTLYTPYVDGAGKVMGTFPEQTPYLEWQESIYGRGKKEEKHCQNCHMPIVDGEVMIAKYAPSGTSKKAGFAQHHFVGGNVHMLKLLRDNVQNLQLTATSKNLDETIRLTEKQLKELTAEITFENVKRNSGDHLTVEVMIKNLVGHKFPSGFPSRRTWLHFVVKGNDDSILFESGRPLANGGIAGNDNDESIDSFEPHYDVVNKPDQVQIYETIMGNTDSKVTYTLLRAGSYLKDNRLLPEGFDKKSVDSDIAVYGVASGDENFDGGGDLVTFDLIQENFKNTPLTIEVELLFEPVSQAFIENLKAYELEPVQEFIGYWQKTDRTPVVISTAKYKVE